MVGYQGKDVGYKDVGYQECQVRDVMDDMDAKGGQVGI